jgi:RNA polymerase sigma-70 factor (ECF subfamily)
VDPRPAAERLARESYGRLVAILAARTRDVAAAEDALSDALASALVAWARDGVPANPEGWLVTAARRRLLDSWRHGAVEASARADLLALSDEIVEADADRAFPDERLKLMFICAHPKIDAAVRAPLMLQTVLGLDSARIAGAFLTSPSALAQRLVRAKQKIRDAAIPFEVPRPAELAARLQDVLDGIYGAYGAGWDDIDGVDAKIAGLTGEARQLAEAVVALLPDEPEPLGLLALLVFCDARTAARRDAADRYVPLSEQDATLWDRTAIDAAEALLARAAARARLGPYQLEATIQSAHCQRRLGADVPSAALLSLYDGLMALRPSIGAVVSRACVLAEVSGVEAALGALAGLSEDRVAGYQPYWAVRAHLLERAGRTAEALPAYDMAIALAQSAPVKRYLLEKRARLAS